MIIEIVGKRAGEFKNDAGKFISFCKIYGIMDFETAEGCTGKETASFTVPSHIYCSVPVPCHADIQFNRYGRICGLEVVSYDGDITE